MIRVADAGSRYATGRSTRRLGGLLATVSGLLAVTGTASAHTSGAHAGFEPPVGPVALAAVGVGVLCAAAGALLAAGGARSSTENEPRHAQGALASTTVPERVGRWARRVVGAVALLAVIVVLLDGVLGPRRAGASLATVGIWSVGLPLVVVIAPLVGDPWPTVSPWRTCHRALARVEGDSIAVLGPAERGHAWPAVLCLVVALIAVGPGPTLVTRSPPLTTAVVAGLGLWLLVGALAVGPTWFERSDPLGVATSLLGRVAPVAVADDGTVSLRAPWTGCLRPVDGDAYVVATVLLTVLVPVAALAPTRSWRALRSAAGTSPGGSSVGGLVLVATLAGIGLAAFGLATWAADRLGAGVVDWPGARRAFAPTLLPAAAGVGLAHLGPALLRSLGSLLALGLARAQSGAVFGPPVAGATVGPVDPLAGVPAVVVWGGTVGIGLAGHLAACVAAVAVARQRYDGGGSPRRGVVPVLVVLAGALAASLVSLGSGAAL